MNSLIKPELYATDIGEVDEISWNAPATMTFEEWQAMGRTLYQIGVSHIWWMGDWLNLGERRFGEMYSQALDLTGLAYETLNKYKQVSARVPKDIRQADLSWSHHFAVAYTEESLRGPLL